MKSHPPSIFRRPPGSHRYHGNAAVCIFFVCPSLVGILASHGWAPDPGNTWAPKERGSSQPPAPDGSNSERGQVPAEREFGSFVQLRWER